MPAYDVFYANQASTLVMNARLEQGWRKLKNRWGFDNSLTIPYRLGWSIRAHLRVTAHGTLAEKIPFFPSLANLDRTGPYLSYSVKNSKLEVRVPLAVEQPWRIMSNGRPGLYLEELSFTGLGELVHFSFFVWVVFHAPAAAPVPDVREWGQKLFVSGGQFESSRTRH